MEGSSYTSSKLVWMDLRERVYMLFTNMHTHISLFDQEFLTYFRIHRYESDFIEKIVKEIKELAGLHDQKKKEDVPGFNHQSNKDSTGLDDQKKNRNGADLYNQAVLEVQKILHGADVNVNRSSLEVENNLNGAELYNRAFLEVQRKINGADLYNQAYLDVLNKINGGG